MENSKVQYLITSSSAGNTDQHLWRGQSNNVPLWLSSYHNICKCRTNVAMCIDEVFRSFFARIPRSKERLSNSFLNASEEVAFPVKALPANSTCEYFQSERRRFYNFYRNVNSYYMSFSSVLKNLDCVLIRIENISPTPFEYE